MILKTLYTRFAWFVWLLNSNYNSPVNEKLNYRNFVNNSIRNYDKLFMINYS